jgi:predicted ATPase
MYFTRFKLENWRNFQSLDVTLQKRVFITGPNASGKSNFLDAFRFLRDLALPSGGGLQNAVQNRQGVSRIRCLSARRYSDVVFAVAMGESPEVTEWEYRLAFSQDNNQRAFITHEEVRHSGQVLLNRPLPEDQADPVRLSQTHLEQVNSNKDFRAISTFFNSIRYQHIIPQLIREPDRSVGKFNDPYGGDFLEQLATAPDATRRKRLEKIRDALKIAVPQLQDLELERDQRGTPHLKGLYQHWRPNAGWQSEDQFSDGTLRLLGLLWSYFEGKGPLLLEEPELSLHPAVVQYIPQMLARLVRKTGRQVIMSTHSATLLCDSGIAPDEVLLLRPSENGTHVITADSDQDIKNLLEAGQNIGEVVTQKTAPKNAARLPLFDLVGSHE